MSIIDTLGIDASIFAAIINEPDLLENNSNTTMLRADQEIPYKGSINGKQIDAYVTLRDAAVTRLSLLQQQQRSTGRDYWLVTGVMQPVKLDITLMLEGKRIDMIDLFHEIACTSAGASISKDEFLMNARKIGMKFMDGQPLFFQQFGANFDKFKEMINVFKDHGAQDVIGSITNNKGSIKAAYELKPGMPVTAFEVGTVDRTQSARFAHDNVGQGFLNLVDAQFEQFTRILGLRKSAKLKRAEAESSNLSEDKIVALKTSADLDAKMSRMAISNWAGAQRRLERKQDGSFEQHPIYDVVNLPCGRFTVMTNSGPYECDLWTNNRNKVATESTATVAMTAEEPF